MNQYIYVFKTDSPLQRGLVNSFPDEQFAPGFTVSIWKVQEAVLRLVVLEYTRLTELAGPVHAQQQVKLDFIETYDEIWEQAKANVLMSFSAAYSMHKYIGTYVHDELILAP